MNTTGQLFFRKTGIIKKNAAGKEVEVIMVLGLLGVENPDHFQAETQYVVVGNSRPEMLSELTILQDYKVNLSTTTKGMDAGGILTAPIWRV